MDRGSGKCVECGGQTYAIQVIDRGQRNIHYKLIYTAGDAKPKFGKGYDIEGEVTAEMCEDCGRIVLRGAPKD